MSDLKSTDKLKFEKAFQMEQGYVLDFGNTTFQNFVLEATGLDIDERKYSENNSGSKANRLRAFWKIESNYIVSTLLLALLEHKATKMYIKSEQWSQEENFLVSHCHDIAIRLKESSVAAHLDSIKPDVDNREFNLIYNDILKSVETETPETAIDRIHTYLVKFLKQRCDENGITYDNNKPLHSLMGEYIKVLQKKGIIETEMSERILKSSISYLESFNKVRNDKSLAHDNTFLKKDESIFIIKSISTLIEFIKKLEIDGNNNKTESIDNLDDLPF